MAAYKHEWEHTFKIDTYQTWPRRKWKAYAVRTAAKSGLMRIEYPGRVKFSAKGDTKEQAIQEVKNKIDTYAQTITQKHIESQKPDKPTYTVKTPSL